MSEQETINSNQSWQSICLAEETVSLYSSGCCQPATVSGSPIDNYYDGVASILRLGDESMLTENEALGRLLVLGLVTTTEAYFRSIFLGVLTICPLAKAKTSDTLIAYGAVEYYGTKQLALGLLDGISFASAEEIRKRSSQLLEVSWNPTSSLGIALKVYDQVCHMRHASVHAHGMLNRGNARALNQAAPKNGSLRLVIDLRNLHMVAKACNSIVRAYNSYVWRTLVQRWMKAKVLTGDWKNDKFKFAALYELFCSNDDGVAPKSAYLAYRLVRPELIRRPPDSPSDDSAQAPGF